MEDATPAVSQPSRLPSFRSTSSPNVCGTYGVCIINPGLALYQGPIFRDYWKYQQSARIWRWQRWVKNDEMATACAIPFRGHQALCIDH